MKSINFGLLGLLLITSFGLNAKERAQSKTTISAKDATAFGMSCATVTSIAVLALGQTTDAEYLACTALSGVLVGSASSLFYYNYTKLKQKMGKNGALAFAGITTATLGLAPFYCSSPKAISTLVEGGIHAADCYVAEKATRKQDLFLKNSNTVKRRKS